MATELKQMLSELIEAYKAYRSATENKFEPWIEYSKKVAPFCSRLCHAAFPDNEEKFLKCYGACNRYLRMVKKIPLETAIDKVIDTLRELGAPEDYIRVLQEAKAEIGKKAQ